MTDLEQQLRTLISKELGINEEEITRDASFKGDLGADSLDVVEIALVTEEEFGIAIDDDAADRLDTFGEFADYVAALAARKKVPA